MSTAPSLDSSNSRPLSLRKRGDLTARRHIYQGQVYWVIKEPVGLNYYRFPEDSYFVLQQLDGKNSLEAIEAAYNAEFSPRKLTIDKLQSFIGSLHKAGLVQASVTGQGGELLKRRTKNRRQKRLAAFGNVLALRFRGIDPDGILNFLIPWTWWLFTKTAMWVVLAGAFTALMSIFVNWDLFQSRLPTFNEFFNPVSWVLLAVMLGLVKVLHEFGHGLACKRFGGECHEMGFMLLVLTPCLYCNVSDSWTLPNKWHRAAIGAAGIYVELILATIATFVWWYTVPGLVNQLALQVMTICSISTVMFNGNPLLRFDGYYILSDIMEVPNLQQKSTAAFTDVLKKHWLGIENTHTQMMPTRNKPLFVAYSIASTVYRWFVVIAILTFLNRVFEPWGLKVLGQMIAVMSIGMMLGMPAYKIFKFFRNPAMRYQVKRQRSLLIGSAFLALLAIVMAIPFPYHVRCEFTVRPRDSINVYVQTPGEIRRVLVKPLQEVRAGDPIIELENLQIQVQLEQASAELREKQEEQKVLKAYALSGDATAISRLAVVESEVQSRRELVTRLTTIVDRLVLRAPRDGTVLPVVDGTRPQSPGDSPLAAPLAAFEPHNANAWLSRGMPVCTIGNSSRLEALMSIPEEKVTFVKAGLDVELKADAFAGETIDSRIEHVGRVALAPPQPEQAAPESTLGAIAAQAVPTASNQYFATADLGDGKHPGLKSGSVGMVKIRSGNRNLYSRFSRWAADTFRFR
jgi:putative peptide zinc metalloprotease protein